MNYGNPSNATGGDPTDLGGNAQGLDPSQSGYGAGGQPYQDPSTGNSQSWFQDNTTGLNPNTAQSGNYTGLGQYPESRSYDQRPASGYGGSPETRSSAQTSGGYPADSRQGGQFRPLGGSDMNPRNPAQGYSGGGQYQGGSRQGMVPGDQRGGGGDPLDKGVRFLEQKLGQPQSNSTTEKISDGIRKGYEKMTGKNVPIKDQDSS